MVSDYDKSPRDINYCRRVYKHLWTNLPGCTGYPEYTDLALLVEVLKRFPKDTQKLILNWVAAATYVPLGKDYYINFRFEDKKHFDIVKYHEAGCFVQVLIFDEVDLYDKPMFPDPYGKGGLWSWYLEFRRRMIHSYNVYLDS